MLGLREGKYARSIIKMHNIEWNDSYCLTRVNSAKFSEKKGLINKGILVSTHLGDEY